MGEVGAGAELYLSPLSGLINAFHTPTFSSLTQCYPVQPLTTAVNSKPGECCNLGGGGGGRHDKKN